MIPNDFNIKRKSQLHSELVMEYAVGDLVLKMDDQHQTAVEKHVYVVDKKVPNLSCASGQEVDVVPVDVVGGAIPHHAFCASWYWPLRDLVGTIPDDNYYLFWATPYDVDALVVSRSWGNVGKPSSYPDAGKVLRVKAIRRSGSSCTVDLREVPSGVAYNQLGAASVWPLSATVCRMEEQVARDPRFPHDCPACKKPAYIGAYGAECSAKCGVWVRP